MFGILCWQLARIGHNRTTNMCRKRERILALVDETYNET